MARYEEIRRLFPHIYDNNLEIDTIAQTEAKMFDDLDINFKDFINNQYITTATLRGIEEYERMYGIVSDPVTESIEFRRARIISRLASIPPYTMIFLRQRLDQLIGEDNYMAHVDYNNHTLYIEGNTPDSSWYHEIFVFINQIKPASLIFSFTPLDEMEFRLNEQIDHAQITYYYKLNGQWALGIHPFAEQGPWEETKLPNIPSITNKFLQDHTQFSADSIAQVLVNNSLLITNINKDVSNDGSHQATITYIVPLSSGIDGIENIKLQDSAGNNLTDINLYVPIPDEITMKHIIRHVEGLGDEN